MSTNEELARNLEKLLKGLESEIFEEDLDGLPINEMDEVVLSYAISIHKSQGSEYKCVIIPIHTQHYIMLKRIRFG